MPDADLLRQHCAGLDDLELARALTLEQGDHDEAFAAEAETELARRGTSLAGVLDRVELRLGPEAVRAVTVEQAVDTVRDEVPRRAVAGFTRCLGDMVLLQREAWGWVFHCYQGERYELSYLVDGTEPARLVLQRFLSLQDWRGVAGAGQHLDDWKTLVADEDTDTVFQLADRLHSGDVPHVVRPPVFTPEGDNTVALLVPPERVREAAEVAGTGRAPVRRLQQRVGERQEAGDLHGELAVYDELADVDGDNHAVHYNRGVVLLELQRHEEAATAFMEAVACGMAAMKPNLSLGRGPTSGGLLGLFGVFVRLFGRAAGGEAGPHYPDWLDDADLRLRASLQRLGPRLDLLHSLASLARMKGDGAGAAERYREILAQSPDDEVARAQLASLDEDETGADAPH